MQESVETEKLNNTSEIRRRFAISIFWVFALLIISWLIWGIQFAGNDDGGMMYYISGAYTGQPEPYVHFCGPFFSWPLALLYEVTDAVPWYILSYLMLCFLSCWMICQMMLKNCTALRQRLIRLGLFTVLFFCMYSHICVRPQFTTVAILCGATSVSILLSSLPTDGKGEKRLNAAAMAFFSLMAMSIRPAAGLVTLAVIFCTVVLMVLQKKQTISWAAFTIAEVAVIYAATQLATGLCQTEEWSYYLQFNPIRARFTDYPTAPFDTMRDVYASVDWDEPLYTMAKRWYFLDHRCTYEAFSTLAQANVAWLENGVQSAKFLAILNSMPIRLSFSCLGLALVWEVLNILCAKNKKERLRISLGSICYPLGGIVLIFYFAWQERMPQRIIDMILCISLTPYLFEMLGENPAAQYSPKQKRSLSCGAAICLAVFLVLSYKQMPYRIPDYTADYLETDQAEAYCASHQEFFFIKQNYALEMRPFSVNTMDKPRNVVFWGGALYPSPLYMRQLRCNGYEQFDGENLFDDNVRFINSAQPNSTIMAYLKSLSPTASYILTDEKDGVKVYRFIR